MFKIRNRSIHALYSNCGLDCFSLELELSYISLCLLLVKIILIFTSCMQDTFARATYSAYAAARPSARVTIGYLVYKFTSSKVVF